LIVSERDETVDPGDQHVEVRADLAGAVGGLERVARAAVLGEQRAPLLLGAR